MKTASPSTRAVSFGFACALALNTTTALSDQIWVQGYDGPGRMNRATAVAADSAGNVAVTGFSDNATDDPNNYGFNSSSPYYDALGTADYYTAKYAAGDGHLLWEKRYNGPAHGDDVATDVKMDAAGNVVVTGYSLNADGNHYFYTAKYAAADGGLLWEYRGPVWSFNNAKVAIDSSGNIVLTGVHDAAFYTAKYAAADGSLVWEQSRTSLRFLPRATWGGPAVDSSGNVIVNGTVIAGDGTKDIYTEKYAAEDGHVLWAQRYHSPGSLDNNGTAVGVDSAGNVIVTGYFFNTEDEQPIFYYTAKYAAADGSLVWEQQYHNSGTGSWGLLALDNAGNAFVTAWTSAGAFVVKYAGADGQQLWLQPFQSCNPGGDYPRAIAANSAGNVIVAGDGYDGDTTGYVHYHTVRYAAADGQVAWQANYLRPGNLGNGYDELWALALDGLGNAIVTGYSQTSSGDYFTGSFSYATVKYFPSGTTPGTINGPANIVTSAQAGQCSAVVNFASPSATDECGHPQSVACSPPAGSSFPKGTSTVTCSTPGGAQCSFTVTVNDTEQPTIACPANIVAHPPCGQSSTVVSYATPQATDNCSGVTVSCAPSSGSVFPAGTTTVHCTAADASGNTASCSFTVTVDTSASTFQFEGFLTPIGGTDANGGSFADPIRTFKLKSTIPVKFKASCDGSPVVTGVHTLQAIKYSNQTTGDTPIDATPTEAATSGNQFRLTGEEWHFNLDTKATGMSAGIWLLRATLSDGSQHSAWIQIK